MNVESGRFEVQRPRVGELVSRHTAHKLAERLFRKNLAAQYVTEDHGFLVTEDKLVQECVDSLRRELTGVLMVHLTIAGIHLTVMEAAQVEAEMASESHEDIEEHVLEGALQGVEEDSLKLLAALAMPA